MMDWANDYVGIPYVLNGRDRDGCDCWGILVLVFQEQRGIVLPDWRRDGDTLLELMETLHRGLSSVAKEGLARRVDEPEPWAIVLAHHHALPHHVGVIVGSHVLHAQRGLGAVCAPLGYFRREYGGDLTFWRWGG